MARVIKNKELVNTRLANSYGGWIYCTNCDKNIGYLCYATYDNIKLKYVCNCGSSGSVNIDFEDSKDGKICDKQLTIVKNRLCCPDDISPLITLLSKNVNSYALEVTCNKCSQIFKNESK